MFEYVAKADIRRWIKIIFRISLEKEEEEAHRRRPKVEVILGLYSWIPCFTEVITRRSLVQIQAPLPNKKNGLEDI